LTRLWLLLIIFLPVKTFANPVIPTFRTGSSSTNSTSQSVVTESVTSYQYRTGYSLSVSGHNIESDDINGYINAIPTAEATQTVNGINFSYTGQKLDSVPRWKIVNESQPFSLVETVIGSGIDTITKIERTINTTTTTTVETTFGQ
tara:strand:+ start:548 stop:985 length:438 start_codon:yes stop_codon:yes gene_type:complete